MSNRGQRLLLVASLLAWSSSVSGATKVGGGGIRRLQFNDGAEQEHPDALASNNFTPTKEQQLIAMKRQSDLQERQESQQLRAKREDLAYKSHPRKVFVCCLRTQQVELIFPQYDEMINLRCGNHVPIESLIREHGINEHDVIMGNIMQAEACVGGGILKFPGKHLYVNPEGVDELTFTPRLQSEIFYDKERARERKYDYLPPGRNVFVIGSHPDSPRSIQISIGIYLLVTDRFEDLPKIIDPSQRPVNNKTHFLAYFQSHYVDFREEAVLKISETLQDLGKIHVGRNCQGNPVDPGAKVCYPAEPGSPQSKRIEVMSEGDFNMDNNNDLESNFRFTVVFENQHRPGYITEKLINAFLSGTVPIYWGTREVLNIFNPRAFIYYDVENPQPALDMIRKLEEDPEAYDRVLRQPILKDGQATVEKYFSFRDDVGSGQLRYRIMDMMGFDIPIALST